MSQKKRATYTSKGERQNISRSTVTATRRDVPYVDKMLNKLRAWKKGRNPWITVGVEKVRANDLYGDPRRPGPSMGNQNDD